MGQYYVAASLTNRKFVKSYTYDNGAKLAEHSWLKNAFVLAVERLLAVGGKWYKTNLVWAGDYAPTMLFLTESDKEAYEVWYMKWHAEHAAKFPSRLIPNVYDMASRNPAHDEPFLFHEVKPKSLSIRKSTIEARMLINHTKQEFVDKQHLPTLTGDYEGWHRHPLPILCSSGNGSGGGDYDPITDKEIGYVGSWAGDSISVAPVAPEGYTEIHPDFMN